MPPALRSPVASMRAGASSGMRPRPMSTSVPTMMRTMFLRKAVASMSKVMQRPLPIDVQAAHDPVRRLAVAVGGAEGAEVVLAHQRRGGARGSASVSSGSRTCQAVRASRGDRTKWFQTV